MRFSKAPEWSAHPPLNYRGFSVPDFFSSLCKSQPTHFMTYIVHVCMFSEFIHKIKARQGKTAAMEETSCSFGFFTILILSILWDAASSLFYKKIRCCYNDSTNHEFKYFYQIEKLEAENSRLQQELQDARDQNELLEFRNLELEVMTSHSSRWDRGCQLKPKMPVNWTLNLSKGLLQFKMSVTEWWIRCNISN